MTHAHTKTNIHNINSPSLSHTITHTITHASLHSLFTVITHILAHEVFQILHNAPRGDPDGADLSTRFGGMVLECVSDMSDDPCVGGKRAK